jgi:hypothetical protein
MIVDMLNRLESTGLHFDKHFDQYNHVAYDDQIQSNSPIVADQNHGTNIYEYHHRNTTIVMNDFDMECGMILCDEEGVI